MSIQAGGNRRYDHAPAPGASLYSRTSEIKGGVYAALLDETCSGDDLPLVFSKDGS
jgi:hypothetical protein